jgi:ABC-type phosphate transport system auxiliary subunit
MKVSLENVEATLLEKKIEPLRVQEIIRDLEQALEEEKADREANADPKQKWEHVIVLHDKEGILKDKEIAGWVVQQAEGEDAGMVLSKLSDAAKEQNESAKRKKSNILDLVSLFEGLKSKFTKERKVRIKTPELTRVIITDGSMK